MDGSIFCAILRDVCIFPGCWRNFSILSLDQVSGPIRSEISWDQCPVVNVKASRTVTVFDVLDLKI